MNDDPVQSPAARHALDTASLVAVTIPALCEFAWVLFRIYKRPRPEIASSIRKLLAAAAVKTDRPAAEAGLAFLDANGDFADGAIAHQGRALGGDVFLSFDQDAVTLLQQVGKAAAPLPPQATQR